MFVFKEEYPKDGQHSDYCREYRSPKDYGYPCEQDHEEKHHEHQHHHRDCASQKPCSLPLAEAYIPQQKWDGVYPAEEGLKKGTVFPTLFRPYEKGRCALKCCEAEAQNSEEV